MKFASQFLIYTLLISLSTGTLLSQSESAVFTKAQAISFIDSIASLDRDVLYRQVTSVYDSVYRSGEKLNTTLNDGDFSLLKKALYEGSMAREDFESIFPYPPAKRYKGDDPVALYHISFDEIKTDYQEFAVVVGPHYEAVYENDVYFFRGNEMLERHQVFHNANLNLDSFQGPAGKTIVHYDRSFGLGNGLNQYNTFFYQLESDGLSPVLNRVKVASQEPIDIRWFSFKSEKVESKELSFKFTVVGEFRMYEPKAYASYEKNAGTMKYNWDASCQCYQTSSSNAMTPYQLATFTLNNTDYLFINVYADKLKALLENDRSQAAVLPYLNFLKAGLIERRKL